MHKILLDIFEITKEEVKNRKNEPLLDDLTLLYSHTSFKKCILKPKIGDIGLIAEVKLASPTEGQLGREVNLLNRLQTYQNAGADAVSIITESKIFKGAPGLIATAKRSILDLPILQKDFVIDDFQIEESRRLGADALLLIARIVDKEKLRRLVKLCKDAEVAPIVEIHNLDDLVKAIKSGTEIIAVNARDLDTFTVDVDRACALLQSIPEKFIKLGFSGIHSRAEVEKYKQAGVNAVLVGTELMRTSDINKFIKELKHVS